MLLGVQELIPMYLKKAEPKFTSTLRFHCAERGQRGASNDSQHIRGRTYCPGRLRTTIFRSECELFHTPYASFSHVIERGGLAGPCHMSQTHLPLRLKKTGRSPAGADA